MMYLMWLNIDATFIFLLQSISKSVFDQLADMIYMPTTFGSCNGIDKTHLLETIKRRGHSNLPPENLKKKIVKTPSDVCFSVKL